MTNERPAGQVAVVIPACNEEAVLPRTLASLAAQDGMDVVRVVVVPNGCTDATARVARSFSGIPDLRVVELTQGSKTRALNAAEAVLEPGPRIYLDADIELGEGVIAQMLAALDTPRAVVVCPQVRFDTAAASAPTRAFYDVFTQLPHVTGRMTGGLYGLSRAGRARFAVFPDVLADDTFVKRLFTPDERVAVPGEFTVQTPRDLRSLVTMRTRLVRGNRELAARRGVGDPLLEGTDCTDGTGAAEVSAAPVRDTTVSDAPYGATSGGTARALASLLRRRPAMAGKAAVYVGVVVAARLRGRSRPVQRWERDDSSRTVTSQPERVT